ncbi:MAG: DNA-3-methyladenine glycosylase [Chloroflexota bacterium]|nr:DNA-3-methyladenine glycosylase [Chloroflexota bacterium]
MVARDLIGRLLRLRRPDGDLAATIIETEAYLGADDPASHSHRGPTPRAAIMFGPPGVAYVYLIYGMHHCLNAVTEPAGTGAAVLIRALDPEVPPGVTAVAARARELRGPGLVCRAFGIDLGMNGWDLTTSNLRVLAGEPVADQEVETGPRVGITRAADLPLRFRRRPRAAGVARSPRS